MAAAIAVASRHDNPYNNECCSLPKPSTLLQLTRRKGAEVVAADSVAGPPCLGAAAGRRGPGEGTWEGLGFSLHALLPVGFGVRG